MLDPATYIVTAPGGRRDTHVAVIAVPGAAAGTASVVLTLDGGRAPCRGRYTVRFQASALGDAAGNPLNGSFYFGFPTGVGTKVATS